MHCKTQDAYRPVMGRASQGTVLGSTDGRAKGFLGRRTTIKAYVT